MSVRPRTDVHRVSITVDSRLDHVPFACVIGRKLCELVELDQTTAFNVELCISEVVANCVRHGYEGEAGHEVEVDFELSPKALVICVYDSGLGVPEENQAPADISFDPEDLETIEEGGRGTFLVHSLMTSVEYSTDAGRNLVRMTKQFEGSTSSSAVSA